MTSLYYTAPSQEAFDDMKSAAERVWSGYDDPYRSEKMNRIAHVQNIGDNFMFLFAMFDMDNQRKVVAMLDVDTCDELRARMVDGGNTDEYLLQIGL